MCEPVRRTLALLCGRVGSTSAPSAPSAPGRDDDPARRAAVEGAPTERDSEPMPALAEQRTGERGEPAMSLARPSEAAGAPMTEGAP
jgi:hypothetical protein